MELFIEGILGIVLEVLGIVALAVLTYFAPKIKRWFDITADKDNSGIVSTVVDMAVELAEKELTGESGEAKFEAATNYVAMMLGRYKIDVSGEFISGAVQSGWRRMHEQD